MTKIEARVTALERELGVDAKAQDEVTRLRAAALEEARERRAGLLARVRKLETEKLAALRKAQKAAERLAAAARDYLKANASQCVVVGEVHSWVPTAASPMEAQRRLGGLIAEQLAKVSRTGLGSLTLGGVGGIYSRITDWASNEAKAMDAHLAALEQEIEK